MYLISGIDGMESDYIEDILADNNIYYETFEISNGIYEIEIEAEEQKVNKLLNDL